MKDFPTFHFTSQLYSFFRTFVTFSHPCATKVFVVTSFRILRKENVDDKNTFFFSANINISPFQLVTADPDLNSTAIR